jgi:hypothetical protein
MLAAFFPICRHESSRRVRNRNGNGREEEKPRTRSQNPRTEWICTDKPKLRMVDRNRQESTGIQSYGDTCNGFREGLGPRSRCRQKTLIGLNWLLFRFGHDRILSQMAVASKIRVKICFPFLCTPLPSTPMSNLSPIGFREFSEDDYRKFIRTLSDEKLVQLGKTLRMLVYPKMVGQPSAFERKLELCREEYRRRNRK